MKKLLLLLLVLATVFTLAACKGKENDTTNTGETDTNAKEEVTSGEDLDEICELDPNLKFDKEVFTFAIYENTNVNNNMLSTETPDSINKALDDRRYATEERLGIQLDQMVIRETLAASRIPISGGTAEFDVTNVRCTHGLSLWQEGLTVSYETLPYIEVEKNYWNKDFNKTLALNGTHYIYIGDMMMSTYDLTYAMLFNKGLHDDYGLDSIYDLVTDNKWTMDAMFEMMKAVARDVNEDGQQDAGDMYGYTAHYKQVLPNFWIAAGEMAVKKDSDDMPYLAMNEERFLDVFERVYEITWDAKTYYGPADDMVSDVPPDITNLFISNQSLFIDTSFYYIQQMRQSETDFGIIPYPKFNEEQKQYYSRVSYYNAPIVPSCNTRLELTGAVLEYFNYMSRVEVVPEYYDKALRGISVRDGESQEMLDLIFKCRVVDLGDTMLCDQIRDDFVWTMFKAKDSQLVSKLPSAETAVKSLVDSLLAMNNK